MTKETSAKINARYLAGILKEHHCTRIVVAPGSRNAPLIMAFEADGDYKLVSIPDERVAAFTAMGMALGSKEPVAVICSSGSAVVNFYPAVVEAFYLKLPLVIVSADRPLELIDQGVGQTIRQENVFGQHIVKSVNLLREPQDRLAQRYNQRLINEALLESNEGPVHINAPFDEPLYETAGVEEKPAVLKNYGSEKTLNDYQLEELADSWNELPKKWVLAGQSYPNSWLTEALDKLNEKSPFLTFTETVSNLPVKHRIASIDRLINTLSEAEKRELQPDLLITTGGEIVSKMVKQYLKDYPPRQHWHISESGELRDTFLLLDNAIEAQADNFFEQLLKLAKKGDAAYRDQWLEVDFTKSKKHFEFLQQADFSDLKAFQRILESLPENTALHTANSTAIRYSQLFDHQDRIEHYSNRGTSGIDGCTSTAVGHAMVTDKTVTLISGEIAFLYDSNALWNDQLPSNFRAVVLNNRGGNIFRIIQGPKHDASFERFQETYHTYSIKGFTETYGVDYYSASSEAELIEKLNVFFNSNSKPVVLEVFTPRMESPKILKDYFKYLKDGKY